MENQKEIFKRNEGDHWFSRNIARYESENESKTSLTKILTNIEIKPKKLLEIGCSNGHRLNVIREEFDCECFGIDPSPMAINDGMRKYPDLSLHVSTADQLNFSDEQFDTILFGFCLYLCDRKDLFKIAYETDRCLQSGGVIAVTDFVPPFPYKNRYTHCEDVYSYKMDHSGMFTWNPVYTEIYRVIYSHSGFALRDIPDERVGTIILKKGIETAYQIEPFRKK